MENTDALMSANQKRYKLHMNLNLTKNDDLQHFRLSLHICNGCNIFIEISQWLKRMQKSTSMADCQPVQAQYPLSVLWTIGVFAPELRQPQEIFLVGCWVDVTGANIRCRPRWRYVNAPSQAINISHIWTLWQSAIVLKHQYFTATCLVSLY